MSANPKSAAQIAREREDLQKRIDKLGGGQQKSQTPKVHSLPPPGHFSQHGLVPEPPYVFPRLPMASGSDSPFHGPSQIPIFNPTSFGTPPHPENYLSQNGVSHLHGHSESSIEELQKRLKLLEDNYIKIQSTAEKLENEIKDITHSINEKKLSRQRKLDKLHEVPDDNWLKQIFPWLHSPHHLKSNFQDYVYSLPPSQLRISSVGEFGRL